VSSYWWISLLFINDNIIEDKFSKFLFQKCVIKLVARCMNLYKEVALSFKKVGEPWPIALHRSVAIATCRKPCFPQSVLLLGKTINCLSEFRLSLENFGCHFDTQKRLKKHCLNHYNCLLFITIMWRECEKRVWSTKRSHGKTEASSRPGILKLWVAKCNFGVAKQISSANQLETFL